MDWALHGYGQVSYYAWLATHLNDPLARWADARLAGLVAYRQEVNGDGRFTGESVPDGFYREAVMARRIAIAYLHHVRGEFPAGPMQPPPPLVRHLPDIKLILHRSRRGLVSVSYGARVMALVISMGSDGAWARTGGQLNAFQCCGSAVRQLIQIIERIVLVEGNAICQCEGLSFRPEIGESGALEGPAAEVAAIHLAE